MSTVLSKKPQGQQVHKLANLGGLVTIAGLDNLEPSLFLGILLQVAKQLPNISPAKKVNLRNADLQKLLERNSERGKVPLLDKDVKPELFRLMG